MTTSKKKKKNKAKQHKAKTYNSKKFAAARKSAGKNKKTFLNEEFLSGRFLYVLVFASVVFIQLLLYAVFGLYPIGDKVYLRMDCYHQYAPFLKEFAMRMSNGEGLFFAWENGLGVNYWAHFAYYLTSPINILVLILPQKFLIEAIEAGMIIKGGLAGVSFLYYLNHRFGGKNVLRAVFAAFYALSGFFLAYSCNIMWTDCYILFPIIMLGTEQIAKGKKSLTYGIALTLSIWANFYISVIAGLAIVLYFVICLIIYRKEGNIFLKIARFIYTTVIAGLMMGVILLPLYLCLKSTAAGSTEFPTTWESYYKFYEVFERMLINTTTVQRDSELPNIFASVLALFLLPLYFCNREISLSKKITKGLLAAFVLFGFQWNVFTYVWHGLHFPNSFPARHSFFFVFLMLSMAAECFEKRQGIKKREIIISSSVMCVGIGGLWYVMSRDDWLNSLTTYLCSVLFIVLYTFLFILEKNMRRKAFMAVFFAFTLVECVCNTLTTGMNSTVSRKDYLKGSAIKSVALDYIKDEDSGFYRTEDLNKKFMNGAAWDGYYGASYFSSTISGGVKDFYDSMGLRYSDVAYSYQGGNPMIASLFNIKYFISDREEAPGETFTGNEVSSGDEKVYVYENTYPLSVGIGLPEGIDERFDFEIRKPFKNENLLYSLLIEDENALLFRSLQPYAVEENKEYTYGTKNDKKLTGTGTVYYVPAGVHAYFYVNNYIDALRILTQDADRNTVDSKKEEDLKFRHILDTGVYDEGRYLVFVNLDDPKKELTFQAYCFNDDAYIRLMDKLGTETLDVTSVSSGKLSGTVHCTKDERLVFSIPYDTGFTVRIDGVKTEPKAFANAFLSVPVTAGDHSVEVSYVPPGFVYGLYISLFGAFLAAAAILISVLVQRKKTGKKDSSV